MHLRKVSQQKNETSIEEPLNTDCNGNELLLSDILGSDTDLVSNQLEREAENQMLRDIICELSEREKTIMKLRFGLFGSKEFTQKEVADSLGISQSYISRLEKRIIKKLNLILKKVS
jgi:RNA polymerase sporulation-specific sigma factor